MERQAWLSQVQNQEERYRQLPPHWINSHNRYVCSTPKAWEAQDQRKREEEIHPHISSQDPLCNRLRTSGSLVRVSPGGRRANRSCQGHWRGDWGRSWHQNL